MRCGSWATGARRSRRLRPPDCDSGTRRIEAPAKPANGKPANVNRIGLTQQEYRGGESTLCQGCGHNSITSQIIAAAYDISLQPHRVIKVSGIGCSSKSQA